MSRGAHGSGSRTPEPRRGAPASGRVSISPTTGSTRSGTRSSGTAFARRSTTSSTQARRSSSTRTCSPPDLQAAIGSRSTWSRSTSSGFRNSGRRRLARRPGDDHTVRPRIDERRLKVLIQGGDDPETRAALAAQEESLVEEDAVAVAHLVAGAAPAPDWSRLLLNAHAEGWPAVGGAVEPTGGLASHAERRRLAAWAPGGGRNPRFPGPLLFPSLLDGLEPETYEGLPAYSGSESLFEGRAVVRLRRRSGRRTG